MLFLFYLLILLGFLILILVSLFMFAFLTLLLFSIIRIIRILILIIVFIFFVIIIFVFITRRWLLIFILMRSVVNYLSLLFLINFPFLLILFIRILDLLLDGIQYLGCVDCLIIIISLNFSWNLALFSYSSSWIFTIIFSVEFFPDVGIFRRINFMLFL